MSIEELCENKGLRLTEQRRVIAKVLDASNDHPDVEELHKRAIAIDNNISVATVYRTVRLFEESGILIKHEFGDGRSRYENFQEKDHHDHLIDIENGTISSLEGKDAVVHLAGESINKPIAGKIPVPWTKWKRKEILESRVKGTRLVAEHIASLNKKPKVLVCASAVGYYGDNGDKLLTEDAENGNDYFSEVVREWEAAAKPAIDAGIRVVFLRLAPVMSPLGGALQVLSLPAKLGSSPPVAGGNQWWSWISIDDTVGSIYHSIITDSLSGPVNVASPNPVRQKEWAATLAKVLWGRLGKLTTLIPIPGFVLKTFLGEFGDVLALSSIKVDSSKLIDSGYEFRFEELEDCFRHLLGKRNVEDLQ